MSVTRGVAVALGVLLVIHAVTAPVSAAGGLAAATASPTDLEGVAAVPGGSTPQTTPVNASNTTTTNTTNTTARHVGPDLPSSDSTATVVLSELEARLASRLINSSDAVEARQFDTAEAELEGNTTDLIRQYQRVAADSASSTDDEVARNLNLTVQQQRELIDAARNARANYSEYQLARANGNDTRARRIARDLLNSATIGNQTAAELKARYDRLGNTTDINTTGPLTSLDEAQDRLAQLQDTVRAETFVATNLTINTTATASPTRPVRIHGQLSANTTGLPNGTIELTLGEQVAQATTTENGTFTATLRPITVAPGNRTAVVRFIPAPTSRYEPVSFTTEVRVTAVTPTVTLQSGGQSARFNETVVVRGRVSANDTSLASVPVQVTIGEQPIGTTRTNSTGAFTVRERLPASVPNGTQTATVTVSRANTSVRRTTEVRSLRVEPTATTLTLTASQAKQTAVTVTGRLTTANGTALAERPVELSISEQSSVFVRTNEDGRINATLSVPTGVDPSSLPFVPKQLTVHGRYAASGTNLQATTRTATMRYTPPLSQSLRRTGFAALTVLILGGAVVAWRRREPTTGGSEADGSTPTPSAASPEADVATTLSPAALLDQARTAQNNGRTSEAVRLSYAALRHEYVDTYDLNPALTHWELYRALDTELDASVQELLYDVTTAYERATYTERAELLPHSDIGAILNRIEDLVERRS